MGSAKTFPQDGCRLFVFGRWGGIHLSKGGMGRLLHVGFFIPLLMLEARPIADGEVRHAIPHLLLFMYRIMLIVVPISYDCYGS